MVPKKNAFNQSETASDVFHARLPWQGIQCNSIKFSLFPAHINISYNNDNMYIMCRKRGG